MGLAVRTRGPGLPDNPSLIDGARGHGCRGMRTDQTNRGRAYYACVNIVRGGAGAIRALTTMCAGGDLFLGHVVGGVELEEVFETDNNTKMTT